MLISDPLTDKSAAAMDVNIGEKYLHFVASYNALQLKTF